MQKGVRAMVVAWVLLVCQFALAVEYKEIKPPHAARRLTPPITDLLVRDLHRSCNSALFEDYILNAQYTYSDMIALLFGLHVIGYRRGFIGHAPLNPAYLLKAWERRGLPLRDYLVMNYPESMGVRERPMGELMSLGIYSFFQQLRHDWEKAGGVMHQLWIEPRARVQGKQIRAQSKTFLRQFLIEVAFHAQWFDDVDKPHLGTPPTVSYNPSVDDSIATDIGLITLAFGGDSNSALEEFSRQYLDYWYSRTGRKMPRADYLHDRMHGKERVRLVLQERLDGLDIPFTISVRQSRPLVSYRRSLYIHDSNVRSIIERLPGIDHKDLPMTVFVAESTDDPDHFALRFEPLQRYGKFDEGFFEGINTVLKKQNSDIEFVKPSYLTWKQELLIQASVYLLRERRIVSRFHMFHVELSSEQQSTPEIPSLPAETFREFWANEGIRRDLKHFNQEIHRRLRLASQSPN